MQLSQKEASLLKDLKGQEKLCVEKYTKHASCAVDPQLKDLFNRIAQTEQQHFDTISQMECGTVPTLGSGTKSQPSFSSTYGTAETPEKQSDCYLCTDCLATEKHASNVYDVCLFEFKDENARNTLNHIQTEEQGHGKMLYDYMAANAMYQ